jgi:hypothetical protein
MRPRYCKTHPHPHTNQTAAAQWDKENSWGISIFPGLALNHIT